MHIYAFGSICRGEIDSQSDIDLLAIVDGTDDRFDPVIYSIYSYKRLAGLWEEGNPFAWHLASEAKIIFASNGEDFIEQLGLPTAYRTCKEDCRKFYNLYCTAIESISSGSCSLVFELSNIFLAIRNFATCFLLGKEKIKNFSRRSALQMNEKSIIISPATFELLERSRILSIRGSGTIIKYDDIKSSLEDLYSIKTWMTGLLEEV
ncbi:MAG: nucleotidyltransferase domain-containing protein [Candidatus Electrothrix aestuarii]|uniref:Nucleotidyltransferase domain-containing protein n=1 Tax=Candidatus Electrothrix aestuarii TaxID=3062594 RepID=A0AAU8LZM1_9BACT|nr:nucleotidyltransferase domain-containing protein [Candidatus Electrothrix aestuarii]